MIRSVVMGATLAALLMAVPAEAQTSSWVFSGFVSGETSSVTSQPSWIEGGLGRFDVGARVPGDRATRNRGLAQAGVDWTPLSWLDFHVDGLARMEPSGSGGRRAGVVQAFVDVHTDQWRLRAGQFFLPTSRENTGPLWSSPYTLTWSALNSWVAQEVRPIGVDLQWSPNFYITAGATAFRGNDTMGTLLAVRGWNLGSRLTVFNEPLPQPGEPDPTYPIERDLDSRNGYSGRLRLQIPERAMVQLTHLDNRARLEPVRNQYPWRTRYDTLSAQVEMNTVATLLGEYARGWTAVGAAPYSAQTDFDTAYVMLSKKVDHDRLSIRLDRFRTRGHNHPLVDPASERGRALTVALLRDLSPHTRLGLEYVKLSGGDRTLIDPSALSGDTAGRLITLELRYSFP